jgi:hypothetical protein
LCKFEPLPGGVTLGNANVGSPEDSNKKAAGWAAAICKFLPGIRITEKLERVKGKVLGIREIQ